MRFLPSIGGYIYATGGDGAWVNLYIGSTGRTTAAGKQVTLKQETKYPWEGAVKIAVQPAEPAEFALHLRIPGWADVIKIKVNGQSVEAKPVAGYATIQRKWQAGDVVELDLPMKARRIEAHPNVAADVGRVALQRGPIVYCIEGVDHGGKVRNVALPRAAELTGKFEPQLLGGVTAIQGEGLALPPADLPAELYRPVPAAQKVAIKAVPYYAWDNRAAGEMVVWIPETPALAETTLVPSKAADAKVTASFTRKNSNPEAVKDSTAPSSSHDGGVPSFSWQNHKGTKEWIAYAFEKPQMLSGVDVYWFDDADQGGACKVPKSWRVTWKKGDTWEPVAPRGLYTTAKDAWNRVEFEPIPAMELRLEVELQDGFSGGILEWRVR